MTLEMYMCIGEDGGVFLFLYFRFFFFFVGGAGEGGEKRAKWTLFFFLNSGLAPASISLLILLL